MTLQPVIHAGLAKCASTLLQTRIFPRIPGYRHDDSEAYTPLSLRFLQDIPADSPIHELPRAEGLLASNEGHLRYQVPYVWGEYGRIQQSRIFLTNITTLFAERGKVLVVIRRQDSIVQSWLKYAAMQFYSPDHFFLDFPMRGTWPLRKEYRGVPIYKAQRLRNVYGGALAVSQDYFGMLQALAVSLPRERIHVLLFEDLRHNPERFLAGLEQVFETDLQHLRGELEQSVNPSPERPRIVHPFFTRGWDHDRPLLRRAMGAVGALFARRQRDMTKEQRAKILDIYRRDNQRLAEAFGLPLQDYDYY